jgi:hypothetical protein
MSRHRRSKKSPKTARPLPLRTPPSPRRWHWVVLAVLTAIGLAAYFLFRSKPHAPPSATASAFPTLAELLAMTPRQRSGVDIGLMNLRCAEGLHGSEGLDIPAALRRLDEYAERVQAETSRHLHRFRENPGEYQDSEAYFRLLMLAVVMQEDFKANYNPARITSPGVFEPNGTFYADARDVFLHGLTGPPMTGTCSSMPVLYVAVGRRLGYPLRLVSTKNHLFLRWESGTSRLNMDATGRGFSSFEDDHYKTWPYTVTEDEIQANAYLRSMTPEEELASFLSMRGHALMALQRYPQAIAAHREALRLAPGIRGYQVVLSLAEREATEKITALRMRQINQVNALLDPETRNARQPTAGSEK